MYIREHFFVQDDSSFILGRKKIFLLYDLEGDS